MLAPACISAWQLIPPHPAEYVAWLIERGRAEEAVGVQRKQYAHGMWLAQHGYQDARRGLPAPSTRTSLAGRPGKPVG